MQEPSSTVNTTCFTKTNHFFHIRSRSVISVGHAQTSHIPYTMTITLNALMTEIKGRMKRTLPG